MRQVSDLVRIFGKNEGEESDNASVQAAVRDAAAEVAADTSPQRGQLEVGQTTPLRLQAPPPGFKTGQSPMNDGTDASNSPIETRANPGDRTKPEGSA